MSKTSHETIHAKQLISNLFLVAYKLFLYKILIKAAIEAHRDDGSIAQGVVDIVKLDTQQRGASLTIVFGISKGKGEVRFSGFLDTKAGRQSRSYDNQTIKNQKSVSKNSIRIGHFFHVKLTLVTGKVDTWSQWNWTLEHFMLKQCQKMHLNLVQQNSL